MKFRYGIRFLLALMVVFSVIIWIYTQLGFENAHFEIVAAETIQDESGLVSGQINYRMDLKDSSYAFFMMNISPIEAPQLMDIKKGDEFKVNFRSRPAWPIKNEDPHRAFITGRLGIDNDLIIGYVILSDHSRIAIGRGGVGSGKIRPGLPGSGGQ